MGCICSKGIKKDGIVAEAHRSSGKDPSVVKPSLRRLKEVPVVPHVESPPEKGNADSTASTKPCGSFAVEEKAAAATTAKIKSVESGRHLSLQHRTRATADSGSTGIHRVRDGSGSNLGIPDVPNGFFREHVVAGWPGWLTSVAGEAIKGWLPRTTDSFEKLDKIGQGTYSSVYRARDLETGRIVALKKVRFVNMDPESVRFMAREINILRGLDHPNVIKLEGIVMSRTSCSLYLVFEYMDHDLAGLAATPGIKFTEAQIKCFMQQLLSGLDHCHSRGVLHRDIKGANLLVDSNGVLRVGDFGLAAVLDPGRKQPLTSRVVTLWYRPPELLLGATDYDAAVDLWSSGCILAELLAGKPIMPGRTEVEQLHNIFKLCGSPSEEYWSRPKVSDATIFKPTHPYPRLVTEVFREFPSSALALLDTLLAIEPEDRGTAASALQSEFFTIMPLACHPSSLPKFAPSKEYGAKLRDEEARRKREGAEEEIGPRKKRDRKPKLEKENCMEEQKRQANPKICSEKYNPHDDISSGVPIDPPREHEYPRAGGSTTAAASNAPRLMSQRSSMPQPGHARDLSNSEKPRKLDRTVSSHKNEDGSLAKDSTMNYGSKNIRIHYSGPLVPQGGNIDDMLKEHERQIQQAVRKARLDKVKTRED